MIPLFEQKSVIINFGFKQLNNNNYIHVDQNYLKYKIGSWQVLVKMFKVIHSFMLYVIFLFN